MLHSETRVLTTHTGSLPRSRDLVALLQKRLAKQSLDEDRLRSLVQENEDRIVRRQAESHVDIAGDGEVSRTGFASYVSDRMTGFGGVSNRRTATDFLKFPDYVRLKAGSTSAFEKQANLYTVPAAIAAVVYDETYVAIEAELDSFDEATRRTGVQFAETFITAASPGIVSTMHLRDENHPAYGTDKEYVLALADQLRHEYAYILGRGHVLQLDAPDLAMERYVMFGDRPMSEFLDRVELHVEAINRAITGLPRDRIRLHVCWGNLDMPHVDDPELRDIQRLLYKARVGAIGIPFANPRHQHEWRQLQAVPPPPDVLLIPGVIDSTTNYVEHPEVVADRICQIAAAIGDRSRVIAGVDCGFETWVGQTMVAEDVVWKKLATLAAGAELATRRLWD